MRPDDALPSVPVLLGTGAAEALAPAVADGGGTIRSLRPRFVMYAPGRRVAVRYNARVEWPSGTVTDTTLVGTERRDGPPRGSIPVPVAGTAIGVWRWPYDPRMPGLRRATDPAFVRRLLAEAGTRADGQIELSTRTYWPGRRAVIQVTLPGRRLFVKVVRPKEVERLRDVHVALADALPVARCAGWSSELGLVVMEALPGQTIAACLQAGAEPPAGEALLELLHRLASFDLGGEPRRTTAGKIATHVRLLKAVLPGEADALDRFAATYGDERAQPLVTVHGDFHEQQVLVDGGRIAGLLDVDDAGPGQLVDDLALLIGRVRARAHFARRNRQRAHAYQDELLAAFGTAVDPHELRRRAAGALLGRATAPFRGQAPGWPAQSRERLRLAERWLRHWALESGAAPSA